MSDDQIQARRRLLGRGVLITGAAGSVGRRVADRMAAEGATLILTDRPGSDPAGLPAHATFVEADLAARDGIDHLFGALDVAIDRLDILVACTGVGSGPLMEMPEPERLCCQESAGRDCFEIRALVTLPAVDAVDRGSSRDSNRASRPPCSASPRPSAGSVMTMMAWRSRHPGSKGAGNPDARERQPSHSAKRARVEPRTRPARESPVVMHDRERTG